MGQFNKAYIFHCITAYFAWGGLTESRAKLSEIAQNYVLYNTVQLLVINQGLVVNFVLADLIRNFFLF
ncbi:hypothetical protein A1332_11740 [Methylomonas methanica]|jgi:hypothetical protein|uniref:Uncharacterized protein n=1 Tax=Methylomonas methanica TaxID=421 RepID=A0A177MLR3_METMH|nr:hypothetical protein A1332_11740 [Methylomonas methanica]